MSELPGAPDGGPYPDPRSAFFLTVAAVVASGFIGMFFLGLGAVAAIGIGQALAVGTIATIAAKRIPEPHVERIGLRGFNFRSLPLVLCLVPAILLASEFDNYATDWSPSEAETTPSEDTGAAYDPLVDAPENTDRDEEHEETPEEIALEKLRVDLDDPWTLAQAFVISVGITPVVEEFFFRGVIQQSLVARLGMLRGVGLTALLYTLPHLPAVATLPRFFAGMISAFGIGCLLGFVCIATGSILGSILLASLTAFVGIFSFAVRKSIPLPGMNVEGTHLPITVTIASIIILGWAVRAVYDEAVKRFDGDPH